MIKKIILISLVLITSLSAKKRYDKDIIYYDYCSGNCYKVISENDISTEVKRVKCPKEQFKLSQENQLKALQNNKYLLK